MTSSPNIVTDTVLSVTLTNSDGDQLGPTEPLPVQLSVADAVASASNPVPSTLSTLLAGEDQTNNRMMVYNPYEYETVAASQSDQVIGATGAAGDYLESILINCAATTNNAVTLKDGGTTIFTTTAGMAIGIVTVPIKLVSVSGAWKITTGSSVQVTAIGLFT
jgi:hypothetical protein